MEDRIDVDKKQAISTAVYIIIHINFIDEENVQLRKEE